jgi:hypothetical protein
MNMQRKLGLVLLLGSIILLPRTVEANIPPSDCGLSNDTEYSGVTIESCVDPGFKPSDVWIDGNYMYVSRALGSSSQNVARVRVYNISNPAAPSYVTDLEVSSSNIVAAGGVSAGNGMVFAAIDCPVGCSTSNQHSRGWNSCNSWSDQTLIPGSGWDEGISSQGLHTLFYDHAHGFVYGANNKTTDAARQIPFWDTGTTCPKVGNNQAAGTIPVPNLNTGSKIHEVAAAHSRLAVAAWNDFVVFDLSSGPSSATELARVDGNAVHSAWPFASNKFLITEERLGGLLRGYLLSGGALIEKGHHQIPAAKGASYHEVLYVDGHAHATAFQAGLRTWRWHPDDGSLLLSSYFDTSAADCGGGCSSDITTWVGAEGVSFGSKAVNHRLVAVTNHSESPATNRRVFLLRVFTPNVQTCQGFGCEESTPTPGGNAPYNDLLVARSSDDGVTLVGKLVRYPGTATGLGSPVVVSQSGLTARHEYGYAIVTGDFDGDGRMDVAVGAPGQEIGGIASGVVYVYRRTSSNALVLHQVLSQTGLGTNRPGERFGAALAAGDFDGDGDDDLAVGAPVADEVSGVPAGAVFLFRASSTGLSPWTTLANTSAVTEGDRFGAALAAGDFDGDRIVDLAVGAPQGRRSTSSPHSGVVYLYRGMSGGAPTAHSAKTQAGLDDDEVPDRFGAWLAVGDWNGDGRDDLLVSAPGEHIGDVSSGRAYAFLGSARSLLFAWTSVDQAGLDTNEEVDLFARRATAGDFDGDGLDDIAVAAPGEQVATGIRSGKVYVLRGATTGFRPWVALDQSSLGTNDDLDAFGEHLAAGDWNGDGRMDLVIVAPGLPRGAASNPLFLFRGSMSGPLAWQTLQMP